MGIVEGNDFLENRFMGMGGGGEFEGWGVRSEMGVRKWMGGEMRVCGGKWVIGGLGLGVWGLKWGDRWDKKVMGCWGSWGGEEFYEMWG